MATQLILKAPQRTAGKESLSRDRGGLRRTVRKLAIAIGAVYGLNALVLLGFQPQGNVVLEDEFQGVAVEYVDTLEVGFPLLHQEAAGYVNVLEAEETIHLSTRVLEVGSGLAESVRHHEWFHLRQKEVALNHSPLGGPSLWNPLGTASYLATLGALNFQLAGAMPTTNSNLPLTGALEASADCWVQLEWDGDYEGYVSEQCSPEALWMAQEVSEDRWPTAPGPEDQLPEAAELPSVAKKTPALGLIKGDRPKR